MKITERLNVEHGIFLRQLGHLEGLLRDGASPPAIEAVVRLIAGTVAAHCRIEDRLLVAPIENAFGTEAPLLSKLKAEHDQVAGIVAAVLSGTVDAEAARTFASKLRAHIENEIHFLFPLAEDWLPPERLAAPTTWDAEHVEEQGTGAEASER